MLEVKIPEQFVIELINYFMTKPMAEAEVAVNNLRKFYTEAKHGDGSQTESAS